jgi:5-methylcytosine-specific restriction endonuclease McrA
MPRADPPRRADALRALEQSSWWRSRLTRGRCHYCGAEVGEGELLLAFKVPLEAGGAPSRENAVPACRSCRDNRDRLAGEAWEEYLRGQGWDPDDDDGNGE